MLIDKKTYEGSVKTIFSLLLMALLIISSDPLKAQSASAEIDDPEVAKIIKEAGKTDAKLGEKLTEIYHATKKYKNVDTAIADGYIPDPMNVCETAPMLGEPSFLGAMGIHYFRPDLVGVTETSPRINGNGLHTDFMQPAVLIYEPQEDGSLALVAVENLVFQKAWHEAGYSDRPEFMGHQYFAMADNKDTETDEAHMFQPHYDLHMWLYRSNIHGLFIPFNPGVSCQNHTTG